MVLKKNCVVSAQIALVVGGAEMPLIRSILSSVVRYYTGLLVYMLCRYTYPSQSMRTLDLHADATVCQCALLTVHISQKPFRAPEQRAPQNSVAFSAFTMVRRDF